MAGSLPAQKTDKGALTSSVLEIFKAHCAACHGAAATESREFEFIDDLAKLAASEYVDLKAPENSTLYTVLRDAEMPRLTKAEKAEGKKKAAPLAEEKVALVLEWIRAGAPLPGAIAETRKPAAAATPEPAYAARWPVSQADLITNAFSDLQAQPIEEQADIRYVSLHALHNNNADVSDAKLAQLRSGVRKLLNSLSTNPKVATFAEVGPEGVLFRVKLRDLGWTASLWERVAGCYPQSIDTGVSAALGVACRTAVPILRADWLAANATRAPLYHDILGLPDKLQELEKRLAVDVLANLRAGEVVRSGFTKSGISRANRMVERHALGNRAGSFWVSYDFRESSGRGSLLNFPLGPESAKLGGGAHAFRHAGGEIIFTLPNGFQAYYLTDVLGNRLDGAAPTDIVGDRNNTTGRVEISNGLSCMVCHDRGLKELPPDEVRALAAKFSSVEQALIERIHPTQEKIQALVAEDARLFSSVLAAANVQQESPSEPIGQLAAVYERNVSLEQAAAELGMPPEEFRNRLALQPQLFTEAQLLPAAGMQRDHFVERFPELVARLGLGKVRPATPLRTVTLPGRDAKAKPRPIAVSVSTEKSSYKAGEKLVATVQAAEAGHLRLLYQNAAGEIITLFPNQFHPDDSIPGNTQLKIPAPEDTFDIEISGPPFGTEHLVAIVTDRPFSDEAELRDDLKKTHFADAHTKNLDVAVTKSARVIARGTRGEATARAGFSRVTVKTRP